jgi:hypothetical protein
VLVRNDVVDYLNGVMLELWPNIKWTIIDIGWGFSISNDMGVRLVVNIEGNEFVIRRSMGITFIPTWTCDLGDHEGVLNGFKKVCNDRLLS